MLQATKPIRRNAKQAPERGFLDPATIKTRFYGLQLTGDCLHPEFKDGEKVVFDKEAPLECGCFANFFYRPELVKPGSMSIQLKQMVTAMPPYVTFPWKEHPKSEVHAVIIVRQFNPPLQWVVRCDALLAVHRCLGRADDPEVKRILEAQGWRI